MNFATVFKAFDTAVALREAAKRLKNPDAPSDAGSSSTAGGGLAGQLEARLTNVVVAALKEAFDRDHARLELERAQLEEQNRRAAEALRLEQRRQAVEQEIGRLRLIGGTAFVGWIASIAMLVVRIGDVSMPSRVILGVGWLLLLAGLGSAFTAQGRISGGVPDDGRPLYTYGAASMWLVIAGLAVTALSLFF